MVLASHKNAHGAAFWCCAPHCAILETRVVSMVKHTMLIMQHFGNMHRFGPKNTKLQPEAHPVTPNECIGVE